VDKPESDAEVASTTTTHRSRDRPGRITGTYHAVKLGREARIVPKLALQDASSVVLK
jgi:hypothetical protein